VTDVEAEAVGIWSAAPDWNEDVLRRGERGGTVAGWLVVAVMVVAAALDRPLALLPALMFPAGYVLVFRSIEADRALARFAAATLWGQACIAAFVLAVHGGDTPLVALLGVQIAAGIASWPGRLATFIVLCSAVIALGVMWIDANAGLAQQLPSSMTIVLLFGASLVTSMAAGRVGRKYETDAVVDPLTGMLNRRALGYRAAELQHQAAQSGHAVSVVMVDIDHFKSVNDTHGHATGDRVLAEVAYRIRKQLRAFDLGYRLGGEEFAVVVIDADRNSPSALAERLLAAIGDSPCAGVAVTISAGVATSPGGSFSFDALLSTADAALYEAKLRGRNRAVVAG